MGERREKNVTWKRNGLWEILSIIRTHGIRTIIIIVNNIQDHEYTRGNNIKG